MTTFCIAFFQSNLSTSTVLESKTLSVASLLKICLFTTKICSQYFTQYTNIFTLLFWSFVPGSYIHRYSTLINVWINVVDIAGLYRTCWTFTTVIYTFYGNIYLVYLDRTVSFLHCNWISCLLLSFRSLHWWIEYCLKSTLYTNKPPNCWGRS
jgi:hypothetical protein